MREDGGLVKTTNAVRTVWQSGAEQLQAEDDVILSRFLIIHTNSVRKHRS